MGVTKYRDRRTKVWVVRWGGRKDRKTYYTGKRDPKAAEAIRRSKERELAILESGKFTDEIAKSVVNHISPLIEAKVAEEVQRAFAKLSSGTGRILPKLPPTEALSKYLRAHRAAGRASTHIENIECQITKFITHSKIECVSEFTTEKLNNWLSDTREIEKLGNKTVKDRMQIVLKWIDYTADPQPLPAKAPQGKLIRFWNADEYRAIISQSFKEKNKLAPVIAALALYQPERAEEFFELRREDIHINERRIEIGEGGHVPKPNKSRSIPLFDQVIEVLRPLEGGSGRVFTHWAHKREFGSFFSRVVKRAIGRKEGFRIARHSALTWLADAGVNVKTLSVWAGTSIRKLSENYLGIVPDNAERVGITFDGRPLEAQGLPRIRKSGESGGG